MSHILRDEDTRVVKYCTKTGQTLSDNLTPNCVYKFECNNCSARYVGQTKQLLQNRMRGQKSDCDLARKNKSKKPIATVLHALKYNYEFDYENPKVLALEPNLNRRLFKEMIFINKIQNCVNSKVDTRGLSAIYSNIIDQINIRFPPD
ncbi:hypothetical protein HHI36_000843 [Cryptolaemus montrouzieri]|uniref:GIY-YIG domain-containing protein n=1 Tax=Cryptolaemus montrouzieri TaxID=559131 RepID=A0ABD2P631_9CUCU